MSNWEAYTQLYIRYESYYSRDTNHQLCLCTLFQFVYILFQFHTFPEKKPTFSFIKLSISHERGPMKIYLSRK